MNKAQIWPGYVQVGEVTAPHGIHGEFRVLPMTDFPDRLRARKHITVQKLGKAVAVLSVRDHQGMMIMQVEGITTRDGAEKVRGSRLLVPESDLPELGEGSYYWHQLVGLNVVEADTGRALGELSHVIRTGGAQDVFEVRRPDGKPLLIPALRSVVRTIDFDAQQMVVDLLPGLED